MQPLPYPIYPDHPTWIPARDVLPHIAAWMRATVG